MFRNLTKFLVGIRDELDLYHLGQPSPLQLTGTAGYLCKSRCVLKRSHS